MRLMYKNAIALLITLFFLMAITISIGVGFKHVNEAKSSIRDENFLLQTNIILDDVLTFLKDSPELKFITEDETGTAFDIFLSQSEFIPFDISDIKIGISIKSARRKINLNDLLKLSASDTQEEPRQLELLKSFLSGYNVNLIYVDILKDSVSKYKLDYFPTTDILDAKPDIFRDYIASHEHLQEINEYYKNSYYENSLSKIDFENLFYIKKIDTNSSSYCIDSMYMSAWTRHMLTGMSIEEAQDYEPEYSDDSQATNINGYKLCKNNERQYLDVELDIIHGEKTANIKFEYDILNAKGYNFIYEI
jgi:hypothetical protein